MADSKQPITTKKEESVKKVNSSIPSSYQDSTFLQEQFVDYTYGAGLYKNMSNHKSLDFSNRGFSPLDTTDVSGLQEAAALRSFHQMRIFIEIPAGRNAFINKHGKASGAGGQTFLISSNLPESVSYSLNSSWTTPLSVLNVPLVDAVFQMTSGKIKQMFQGADVIPNSLINRLHTLLIWNKTEPLSMQLTIPVLDDSYDGNNGISSNLAEALEILGAMCLPSYTQDNSLGFYTPPPTPYDLAIKYAVTENTQGSDGKMQSTPPKTGTTNLGKSSSDDQATHLFGANHARIMIQLGGMLLIDNCVITRVDVKYKNTKSQIRHSYTAKQNNGKRFSYLTPQLAEVTLHITTLEAMTTQTYSKMLWCRRQQTSATGTIDASALWALANQGYNAVLNFFNNGSVTESET